MLLLAAKYLNTLLFAFHRVQVRRTDKLNSEAAFHSIEEYMFWVELYYKRLSTKEKIDKKRVFIATDDPSVLPEAQKKYV